VLVEVIFRWPGLGTQLVNAVLDRDYAVAEVLSLLLAAAVVLASALGDVVLRLVDPASASRARRHEPDHS